MCSIQYIRYSVSRDHPEGPNLNGVSCKGYRAPPSHLFFYKQRRRLAMAQIVADLQKSAAAGHLCSSMLEGKTILVLGDPRTIASWRFFSLRDGVDHLEARQALTRSVQMPSRRAISSSVSIPLARNRSKRLFSPYSILRRPIMRPVNGLP
jgi:hypothetical protein